MEKILVFPRRWSEMDQVSTQYDVVVKDYSTNNQYCGSIQFKTLAAARQYAQSLNRQMKRDPNIICNIRKQWDVDAPAYN